MIPSEARYDRAELERQVGHFERAQIEAGLALLAYQSYAMSAMRFVRWLAGDYQPRNASSASWRREERPRRHSWTAQELLIELRDYRRILEDAKLRPLTVSTYVHSAGAFVRWLTGDYTPREGGRVSTHLMDEDDSWLNESSIQSHVVRWLQGEGWRIIRQASGREHGTDIDAERHGVRLAVEVKGHPRRLHVFGVNKGQARKWHPAAQVRTYYGNALHTALSMLHADPDRHVAIALPDVPAYRGLVRRSRDPLTKLGVTTWFVTKDGVVTDG